MPCNIKFLIEGEEEVGSPHLIEYFATHGDKLKCDAIIWESGYVNEDGRPVVTLGMKGLLYVELNAKGPRIDVHSSLAVLIRNPVWRLVKALNTIWNDQVGIVRIQDWYKEVEVN